MAYFSLLLLILHLISGASAVTFTLVNECTYTVWPGILSNAGTQQLSTTGLILNSGATVTLPVPPSWSGRLWARTYCTSNSTGRFSCLTADCGSGTVACSGNGAAPPATLAEFTLNGFGGLDFYDVSLVDGYNLPLVIRPHGGSGNCTTTGCVSDLNGSCPMALRVIDSTIDGIKGGSVACRSACEAFRDPQYCCSGSYSTPNTCKPSSYSTYFKSSCPSAYSYAYDDASSTFTCARADYVITFCPTATATCSEKSTGPRLSEASLVPPSLGPSIATAASSTLILNIFSSLLSLLWLLCHLDPS